MIKYFIIAFIASLLVNIVGHEIIDACDITDMSDLNSAHAIRGWFSCIVYFSIYYKMTPRK